MERRSLLDDAGVSEKASHKKLSEGGQKDRSDKIKLGAAIGLFVIAAFLIAWYADWISFGSTPPPPPPTAEQVKQVEQRQQENKRLEQQGKVLNAGS